MAETKSKATDYHSEEVILDGTIFAVTITPGEVEYRVEDQLLREFVCVQREDFLAIMAVARERELQLARRPDSED